MFPFRRQCHHRREERGCSAVDRADIPVETRWELAIALEGRAGVHPKQFIEHGAVIINATSYGPLDTVAAENPDGSSAVVVLNTAG